MHVFLTGERRAGKSWAVRTIIGKLALPVSGFVTDFQSGAHGMQLFMMPASQPALMDEAHLVAERINGRMQPLDGRFDAIGIPLLHEAQQQDDSLIVMDELGHLEKHELSFQQAVLRCLDGRIPVLGVLRKDQEWHQAIKQHPHVRVLELTEENREQMVNQAVALLQEEMPKGRMLTEALVPWALNGNRQSSLLCSPQEVDALITGLLYTSGRVDRSGLVRVYQNTDGVWQAEAPELAEARMLEQRMKRLPVCSATLSMPLARVEALMEQMMAIDNSNGQHTVMLAMDDIHILSRDIGRHNALDRAIGMALMRKIPLERCVACTSGRISIEILAKVAAAGLPVICTKKQVGNLAEQYASQCNVTIVQCGKQPCIYGAQRRISDLPAAAASEQK